MGKKNLLVFITLLLAYSSLSAHGNFQAKYQSRLYETTIESNLDVSKQLVQNYYFKHNAFVVVSHNNIYKRFRRNSQLNTYFQYKKGVFDSKFIMGYKYIFDEGTPFKNSYKILNKERLAGVTLSYKLGDYLAFQNSSRYIDTFASEYNRRVTQIEEEDVTVETTNKLRDNGLLNEGSFTYRRETDFDSLYVHPSYSVKDLDYAKRREYKLRSGWRLIFQKHFFETILDYKYLKDDIYSFQVARDQQLRREYKGRLKYKIDLQAMGRLGFVETYEYILNSLDQQKNKEYSQRTTQMKFNYQFRKGIYSLFLAGEREKMKRDYDQEINSMETDSRIFRAGFAYTLANDDSVKLVRTLSLKRNDYPGVGNNMDNDIAIEEYQISNYHRWKQDIFLLNHFRYSQSKDVYLFADMSSNNVKNTSWNLSPSLYFLLPGKTMLLAQKYHLMALYKKQSWEIGLPDQIFRKFSAQYRLMFFDRKYTGILSETSVARAHFFNYDWYAELYYEYQTDGTLNEIDDEYYIIQENKNLTVAIDAHIRWQKFIFRVIPKISWTPEREHNHRVEMTYLLSERSTAKLNVNPYGTADEDWEWRTNFTIEYGW